MKVKPLNEKKNKLKPESLLQENWKPKTRGSSENQLGSEDFSRKKEET